MKTWDVRRFDTDDHGVIAVIQLEDGEFAVDASSKALALEIEGQLAFYLQGRTPEEAVGIVESRWQGYEFLLRT